MPIPEMPPPSKAQQIFAASGLKTGEKVEKLRKLFGTELEGEARGCIASLKQMNDVNMLAPEPVMKLRKEAKMPNMGETGTGIDILYLFEKTGTPDGYVADIRKKTFKGPVNFEEVASLSIWEDTDANQDEILDATQQ